MACPATRTVHPVADVGGFCLGIYKQCKETRFLSLQLVYTYPTYKPPLSEAPSTLRRGRVATHFPDSQYVMETDDGSWLTPEGEYQDLVRDLCGSDPRLCRPDEEMSRYRVHWPSRALPCLSARVENQRFRQRGTGNIAPRVQ